MSPAAGADGHGGHGDDGGLSIEVLRGGEPDPHQLAALAVALRPVPGRAAASEPAAAPATATGHTPQPAWTRAGHLEARGGRPVRDRTQLAERERGAGWPRR